MMGMLRELRDDLRFHSMKLALAAASVVSFLTTNTDMLIVLISFVPTDDLSRFLLAATLFVVTYSVPRLVRFWPQPKLEQKEALDGETQPAQ